MRLELWLDESGDFKNDQNPRLNPSLVGGVLIKAEVINEHEAASILGKDYVHFTDESGDFNISKLQALKERGAEFVIFQSAERVTIIDSDTTYLNVLAEGIIQLSGMYDGWSRLFSHCGQKLLSNSSENKIGI